MSRKHQPNIIQLRRMSKEHLADFIAALTDDLTQEHVPENLRTVDFADIWARYIIDRQNIRGEILRTDTIILILQFLKYEPDPVAVVGYAHQHGNKSIRPIDEIGLRYYKTRKPAERYAQRTSRKTRAHNGQKITDTVFKPRPIFI